MESVDETRDKRKALPSLVPVPGRQADIVTTPRQFISLPCSIYAITIWHADSPVARHGRYGADGLSLRRERYYVASLRRQPRKAASTDIRPMWHGTELTSSSKSMPTKDQVRISVGLSC